MPNPTLSADVERHLVRLVEVNLQRAGYQVVTSYDGREALDAARQKVLQNGKGMVMALVSDVDRAVAFYRDELDLPLRSTSRQGAEFDLDGVTLELFLVDTTLPEQPCRVSLGQRLLQILRRAR